jgi:predicted transcriptional regulator
MLEFLISSASRRKILIHLLNNPDKEYHLREISRILGDPAPVIKRELDKLEQIGFIISWTMGNRRRLKVNKNFLLLPELKALVDKTEGLHIHPKVAHTFTLKEALSRRKIWERRSKEIVKDYGNRLKRKRPRHPAEAKMLKELL